MSRYRCYWTLIIIVILIRTSSIVFINHVASAIRCHILRSLSVVMLLQTSSISTSDSLSLSLSEPESNKEYSNSHIRGHDIPASFLDLKFIYGEYSDIRVVNSANSVAPGQS